MLPRAIITELVASGTIGIEPFCEVQLKVASYVLRLGRRLRRWLPGDVPVRMWSPAAAAAALAAPEEVDVIALEPGEFALGCTLERISLPAHLAGQISPLSHVARFGLGVTCGADFINPGFGRATPSMLTLELYNHNPRPLELRAGMPVAHLRFVAVGSDAASDRARSIYEGADPLIAPLLFEEWSLVLPLDGAPACR